MAGGAAGADRALCGRGAGTTPRSRRGWTPRRGLSGRWRRRFFERSSRGAEGQAARGPPAPFSPRSRSPRSRRSPASCRPRTALPLARFSRTELHRLVIERGVTDASASTIWRWLHEDAIKPWQKRSWIFPRDPDFARQGRRGCSTSTRGASRASRLRPDEYVICADEKSQLQALGRRHPTVPRRPGPPGAGRVRVPPRRHARLPRRPGTSTTPTSSTASRPRPGSSRSAASSSRS